MLEKLCKKVRTNKNDTLYFIDGYFFENILCIYIHAQSNTFLEVRDYLERFSLEELDYDEEKDTFKSKYYFKLPKGYDIVDYLLNTNLYNNNSEKGLLYWLMTFSGCDCILAPNDDAFLIFLSSRMAHYKKDIPVQDLLVRFIASVDLEDRTPTLEGRRLLYAMRDFLTKKGYLKKLEIHLIEKLNMMIDRR